MYRLSTLYELFDDDPEPVLSFLRATVADHGLEEPVAVLDMGCGPGRLLPGMTEMGWSVVGFEPDERFHEAASVRASRLDGAEVVHGGWGDLDHRERFDLAIAINGPFAYLLTRDDRRDALHRTHSSLREGGVLVLDVPDLEALQKREEVVATDSAELDGRRVLLRQIRSFDLSRSRYVQVNEYRVERPDGDWDRVETTHHHCILTESDLGELASETRFRDVRIQDGYGEEAEGGRRLLLTARK